MPVSQVLALLVKIIRKLSKRLVEIQKEQITKEIDAERPAPPEGQTAKEWKPIEVSVEKELDEAGEEAMDTIRMRERQRELINSLDLKK